MTNRGKNEDEKIWKNEFDESLRKKALFSKLLSAKLVYTRVKGTNVVKQNMCHVISNSFVKRSWQTLLTINIFKRCYNHLKMLILEKIKIQPKSQLLVIPDVTSIESGTPVIESQEPCWSED